MPAGLGGGGYLYVAPETTLGTYVPPTDASAVAVPILSESLAYTESKYYSPQIRQQTIVSDVRPSYYHIEGDVRMEVDAQFLPLFLRASRHTITGAAGAYTFVPSQAGSASTASGALTPKTVSITVVRDGIGFGYAGCVMGTTEFTIDNGILICSFGVLGCSETTPGGLGTPVWVDPILFGADSHSVYVDASGTAPAFAGGPSLDFNGFTANLNYNATAQNRIRADRSASYISFGETEATYNTELDFVDKAEYDNFKAASTRAVRLESLRGGSTFAGATSAFQLTFNRSAYDTYTVGLGGMADLIMATVTGRALGIAGAAPYTIKIKGGPTLA